MGLPKHIEDQQIVEFRDGGFEDRVVRSHIAQCGVCRGRVATSVLMARAVGRPKQGPAGSHLGKVELHNFYRAAHEWEDLDEKWFFDVALHLLTCDGCVEQYLAYAERYGPSAGKMARALQTLRQPSPEPAGRLSVVVLPAGIAVGFSGAESTALSSRHAPSDGNVARMSENVRDLDLDVAAFLPATPMEYQEGMEGASSYEVNLEKTRQASFSIGTLQAHVEGLHDSLALRLTEESSGFPIEGARVSAWSELGLHRFRDEPFEASTDAAGSIVLPFYRLRRLGIRALGGNWQIEVSVRNLREEARKPERVQDESRRREEEALRQAALQKEKEERAAARRSFDAQRADRRKEQLATIEERARTIVDFRSLEPLEQLRRIATDDAMMSYSQELFPALDEALLSRIDSNLAERLIQRLKPPRKGDLADMRELLIARFGGGS